MSKVAAISWAVVGGLAVNIFAAWLLRRSEGWSQRRKRISIGLLTLSVAGVVIALFVIDDDHEPEATQQEQKPRASATRLDLPACGEGELAYNGDFWCVGISEVIRVAGGSHELAARIPLTPEFAGSHSLALTADYAWVGSALGQTISLIDLRSNVTVNEFSVDPGVQAMTAVADAVFAGNTPAGVVYRLDAAEGIVAISARLGDYVWDVAANENELWVSVDVGRPSPEQSYLVHLDPDSLAEIERIGISGHADSIVLYGTDLVFDQVKSVEGGTIQVLDRRSGRVTARVPVPGAYFYGMAAGPAGVWVASGNTGFVYQLNPNKGEIVREERAPDSGKEDIHLTVGVGEIWVTGAFSEGVAVIDL